MKKNIYKILILGLLFCIAILAVTGCRKRGNDPTSDGGDSTVVQPAEQYVELNENQITLDLYNDYTLQCNVVGISDDVVWSSSDSAIASVENGKVIALSVGDAQITATAGGFTAKCSVTVEDKGVVPAMQNYTRDFEIRRTNTYDVNPTILFAGMEKDISDAQLAFEVADSTVATIDANGIATALKEGTTTFTVSGSFRGITMLPITGTIVVKKNIVIAMNSLNVNIYACDPDGTYETQFQLESAVYVEASLISDAKLDWSSEDEKIVTVENGLITAHRAGTAMINAAYTTDDGDVINAGVVVNVERPVIRLDSLYEFDLSNKSGSSTMDLGELVPYVDGMFTGFYDITDSDRQVITGASYQGKLRLPNRSFAKHGYRRYALESELIAIQFDGLAITRKIYSVNDLESIATSENTLDGYYRLEKDIDAGGRTLSLVGSWTNSSSKGFIGTFEGNGHTISNVCVPSGGFFNCIGAATIRNLGLANVSGTNSVMASEVHGATIENLAVSSKDCERVFNFVGERSKIVNMLAVLENGKYTVTTLGSASDAENVVQNFLVVAGKAEANSGWSGTRVPGIFFNYYQKDDPAELYGLQMYNSIEEMVDELQNNGLPSGFDFGIRLDGSKVYYNDALICRFEIAVTAPATVHRGTSCTVQAGNSTFSLKQSIQGISVNRQTGVVTVAKDVPEFTEFTVVVQHKKYADASAEVTIRVTIDYKPVQTDVFLRYDLSTGKETLSFTVPQFAGTFKRIGWQGTDGFKEGVTVENGTFTLTAEAIKALGTGDGNLCIYTEEENVYYVDAVIADKFIYTYDDLAALYQAKTLTGYYMLANDIEANNANALTLIGTWTNKSNEGFVGTFNGDGHTISNLKVGSAGLFGYIGTGTVKNLGLANVSGGTSVLANEAHGATVENLVVSGKKAERVLNYVGDQSKIVNLIAVLDNGKSAITTFGSASDTQNVVQNFIVVAGKAEANSGWSGTRVPGIFFNYYQKNDPAKLYKLQMYNSFAEMIDAFTNSGLPSAFDFGVRLDGSKLYYNDTLICRYEMDIIAPSTVDRGTSCTVQAENATFSLKQPIQGISVNRQTGVVTVAKDVPEFTEFTVVVQHKKYADACEEVTIRVTIAYKPIQTDVSVRYDLSAGTGACSFTVPGFAGTFKHIGWQGTDGFKEGVTAESGTFTLTAGAMKALGTGDGNLCIYTEEETVYYVDAVIADRFIYTYDDLAALYQAKTLTGYYMLANNIEANNLSALTLIGTWTNKSDEGFVGTFNGDGHTISNLKVGSAGLFGYIGTGTVKNLGLANVSGDASVLANEVHSATVENLVISGKNAERVFNYVGDRSKIVNMIAMLENGKNAIATFGSASDKENVVQNFMIVAGKAEANSGWSGTQVPGIFFNYYQADDPAKQYDLQVYDSAVEMLAKIQNSGLPTAFDFGVRLDGSKLYYNDAIIYSYENEVTAPSTVDRGTSCTVQAENATFSLKQPIQGISVNSQTGVVTVAKNVPESTDLTVVVQHTKYAGIRAEVTIRVTVAYRPVQTDVSVRYDLSAGTEACSFTIPDFTGTFKRIGWQGTDGFKEGVTAENGTFTLTAEAMKALGTGDGNLCIYTEEENVYYVDAVIADKFIYTYDDLAALYQAKTLTGYYMLANDIEANNANALTLIGTWTNKSNEGFVGTFNGDGHIIRNLRVGSAGLFGYIGTGTVKNLGLANVSGGTGVLASEAHGMCLDNLFISSPDATYLVNYAGSSSTKNVISVLENGQQYIVTDGSVSDHNSHRNIISVVGDPQTNSGWSGTKVVGFFMNYYSFDDPCSQYGLKHYYTAEELLEALEKSNTVQAWTDSSFTYDGGALMFSGKMVLMPEIIVDGPNYAYRGKTTKLESPNAVFSLQEAVEGITVAADGTITVAADVPEQTEFTVIATHTAFSQITQSLKMKVTIDYNKIDLTDTMVDFDLSENVSRYRYKIPNFEGTFKALGWEGQDYVDANGIRVRNGELLITKSAMNAIGSGSGTLCVYTEEENVYLLRVTVADKIISNVEELKSISVTGNTLNGYYILDSDISCDDTSFKLIDTWSGSTTTGFVGTFDGRGHIIDGYNGGTSGLFYCFGNTAVVKNVAFTNTTGNTVLGGNENHGATFENIFVGGAAQYITKAAWDSPTYKNVIFVSDNAEAAVFYQGNTGTLTMNNVFVVGSAVHGYWGAKTNETNVNQYTDVDALLEAVGANGELSKWTGSPFAYTDGHLLFNNKTVCQAIVTLTGAQTIAPGKSENYASNGTITLKNAVEGVTLHGGVLTVGSTVPAETVITLVATHAKYPAVTVELEITVIRHYKQIDMTDLGSIGDLETAEEISQIRLPDGMDGNVIGISYGETKMYDDGISVSNGMLNIPKAWTAQVYNTYGFTEQNVKIYTDTDKCYTVTVAIVTKAISDQADLQSIAVDGTLNGYYVLTNDVVCDGTTLINLAGYTSTTTGGFVGVFDGRGYSVSNVNVGTRGLFYGIGAATIRDVAFINMISSNTSGAGSRALAGETHGCVLENVFVSSNAQYMFWTTWHSPTFKNVIFVSGDGANGQIFNEGSTGSLTAENVFLVGKTFCNYWGATISKTNVQTFASLDALLNAFSADGERNKWIGSMFSVADGKLYFNGKAVTE